MDKKNRFYEQLCDPPFLLQAWKRVRANRGVAGVDQVSVYGYEQNLGPNIADLATRLRDGRYIPMPFVHFEMEKANGRMRTLGIATVEDRIVARALYDLLEHIWEPSFCDCSYGFRPDRNVEMAVKRVLDYRAAGDCYIVDADLADAFGSLDHELVMGLIGRRIRDKRLLGLIRLVLAGQGDPAEAPPEPPIFDRVADFATGAVNDAMTHMLGQGGYGYPGYATYPISDDPFVPTSANETVVELRKAARREALKGLGRNAFLIGLSCIGRNRRFLSPSSLALTGAAVLATAAYPKAARLIRKHWSAGANGVGAVQGSALSPLLLNIVLHELDLEMQRAGCHFVRYADDWVVTTRDEESARKALDFATRKLAGLRLCVNPEKTRIIRFEQGLEFLGYKFDPFLLTATPPPASTQQPIGAMLGIDRVNRVFSGLHKKVYGQLPKIWRLPWPKTR